MLSCDVCWGFEIVLDPFVHMFAYMCVVELRFACLRSLEEDCMKLSRVLSYWGTQFRLPKDGSAAEHAKEVVLAA